MNINGLSGKISGKLYINISAYTIFFVFLSFILVWADHFERGRFYTNLPGFFLTERGMAVNIFAMEVASLLAMLTLTFSVMMIVLTNYSSQLSPRTLQDFLENKTTQNVMGYYIGVIVFSLISLYFVKYGQGESDLLSPFFGVIFFIGAILLFAYFIHYVSRSIRINLYIQNLAKETEVLIEKKKKLIYDDFRITLDDSNDEEHRKQKDLVSVKTTKSGFVQFYDKNKLYEYAVKNNMGIYCEKRVGEHILEDSVIFSLEIEGEKKEMDKLRDDLCAMVSIGDETNLYEDVGAGTRKLNEIAVKALSPGINDPATAMLCIEKTGYLLQKLSQISDNKIYRDENKKTRLVEKGTTFEKLLFNHFYQIKHYGIQDLFVLDSLFKSLINIAKDNKYTIKKEVYLFASYLFRESLECTKRAEQEKNFIKEHFYQVAKVTGEKISFDEIL